MSTPNTPNTPNAGNAGNAGNTPNAPLQSVRGMTDALPAESATLTAIEAACADVFRSFGYDEIRLPLLEKTELFTRSIGGATDIVQKEMYTFEDRNGESLTLRPEGTAGCVRAALEHGLLNSQRRLWYGGPFFRHERPQKGRRRQFFQAGAEIFGVETPDADAEIIALCDRVWRRLGIGGLQLKLNSLGTEQSRREHRAALVAYLESRADDLDDDARARMHDNPLRVLDSKNPDTRKVIEQAPRLDDYLDDESRAHHESLQQMLGDLGIAFTPDPLLVRGLDYYTKTVFEWVVPGAGSQSTLCAGGRYDGLVERLGGRATPAAGCAFGIDRIALLAQPQTHAPAGLDVYAVVVGDDARREVHRLAGQLRNRMPHLRFVVNCGGGSVKAQMRRAGKSDSKLALIVGDDEVRDGVATVKDMRGDIPQQRKPLGEVPACIENRLSS